MDKFILTVQKSLLAVSVAMVISPVYAVTDQAEIAQLRQEVQELRTCGGFTASDRDNGT
jgi:hypothetical protein